jgi:hypothetical protein
MIFYKDDFTKIKLKEIRKDLRIKIGYNLFDHICDLIVESEYKYGVYFTKGTGELKNLNRFEDERLIRLGVSKSKSPWLYLPPHAWDGYVEIDITQEYVDLATYKKPVNIVNIIFHELFECYMMVDVRLQYKEAHNYAGVQEKALMEQLPNFTQTYAFDKLVKKTSIS